MRQSGWFSSRWLLAAILLLLTVSLTACGPPRQSKVHTRIVAIDVNSRVNLNHPVAMDLLIIYDEGLFENLLALSAEEWFKKRGQYKLDYPRLLQTWEWELVPGQVVPFFKLPDGVSRGMGALVFANYVTPGTHRARIDPYEGAVIRLGETEMSVLPLN